MVSLHQKRKLTRRSWSLLHQWKLASDSGLLVKMNQRNTMIRYKRNNTGCRLPGQHLLHIGAQSYWGHISEKKEALKNYLTPPFFPIFPCICTPRSIDSQSQQNFSQYSPINLKWFLFYTLYPLLLRTPERKNTWKCKVSITYVFPNLYQGIVKSNELLFEKTFAAFR